MVRLGGGWNESEAKLCTKREGGGKDATRIGSRERNQEEEREERKLLVDDSVDGVLSLGETSRRDKSRSVIRWKKARVGEEGLELTLSAFSFATSAPSSAFSLVV